MTSDFSFRAEGTPLGCFRTEKRDRLHADLYLILVESGSQYVVARYLSGETQWCSGRYFNSHADATELFASNIQSAI